MRKKIARRKIRNLCHQYTQVKNALVEFYDYGKCAYGIFGPVAGAGGSYYGIYGSDLLNCVNAAVRINEHVEAAMDLAYAGGPMNRKATEVPQPKRGQRWMKYPNFGAAGQAAIKFSSDKQRIGL